MRRFIDDNLVIWTGTDETFNEFFNFLNLFHPTIKVDEPQHEFLDLEISIKNGKIHTDLYRKETSKPNALLPSSAHPGHIFSNIVYSMTLRLMIICSEEARFEK